MALHAQKQKGDRKGMSKRFWSFVKACWDFALIAGSVILCFGVVKFLVDLARLICSEPD
jgi:hypothetical protein